MGIHPQGENTSILAALCWRTEEFSDPIRISPRYARLKLRTVWQQPSSAKSAKKNREVRKEKTDVAFLCDLSGFS